MRRFLETILFLLTCGSAFASYTKPDSFPLTGPDFLSTNWLVEVKQAIPSAAVTAESNFQTITNLLRQESQRGNIAAQGLWGFYVLVQSRSQEDAATGLQLLRNSATNGFVPAMLNLGLLSQAGVHVQRDYSEAFHWFSKASDRTNSEALLQLGGCHHYGLGTKRDLVKAADCYRRSSELTNYAAMKSLGYLLMEGRGVNKDIEEAKRWLLRAANEGNNRRAMFNLGVLCSTNVFDTNAMTQAFQWFKQSAELGDGLACQQMANFYFSGWGLVQTNLAAYRFWRSRAAMLGVTEAQYLLGFAYRTGDGVPVDSERSLTWYQKAAEKNHPWALYDLALHHLADKTNRLSRLLAETYMLRAAQAGHREAQFQFATSSFRGDIGGPDCEAGKQWMARSAENGWAIAEFCLFQLYYSGAPPTSGCNAYPKDVLQAIKWLRRAAEHENLQAQSILAIMLITGNDVERNKTEAEKFLRSAAERGYPQAQHDLGFAILNGDISKSDLVEAAMWFRLALAQTQTVDANFLRRAEINLTKVLSRLNASQRLEVDERVKVFRPVPIVEPHPLMKDWESNPAYQEEDGRGGH